MLDLKEFTKEEKIYEKGIYLILHKNTGIMYVGSTFVSFSRRWRNHLNGFEKGKGNKVLLNIYNKYGINGFEFIILEIVNNKEELPEKELYWINYYDTYKNGANISIDTKQPLNDRTLGPLSEEHKIKLQLASKTKKKVYLYDFKGNLIKTFISSVACDREFKLKKGMTSQIISKRSSYKTINRNFVPKYEFIDKKDWIFVYGQTEKSRKKAGLKHRGKKISTEQKNKIRMSNKTSMKCILYDKDTHLKIKEFNSLNECDDFLKLTRGTTSKHHKNKCKFLRRKYYVKII